MIKKDKIEELSPEQRDRLSKLKLVLDQFEETSLVYGPASAEELKNRINKNIRSFDDEFKSLLNQEFELFWSASKKAADKNDKNNNIISDWDIPRFLRNYKK